MTEGTYVCVYSVLFSISDVFLTWSLKAKFEFISHLYVPIISKVSLKCHIFPYMGTFKMGRAVNKWQSFITHLR